MGIEVSCDPDGVSQHSRLDILASIDIDAAHELDEFSRLSLVVATSLIDVFSDQMQRHFPTFAYLTYGKVGIYDVEKTRFSNFRVFHIRDSYKSRRKPLKICRWLVCYSISSSNGGLCPITACSFPTGPFAVAQDPDRVHHLAPHPRQRLARPNLGSAEIS